MSDSNRANRSKLGRALAVALGLVLLLASCSGGDDSGDSSTADVPGATPTTIADMGPDGGGTSAVEDGASDAGGEMEPPRGGDDAGTGSAPVVFDTADLGRSIIYTATVDLQVDDVAAASRAAQEQIAAVGGLVFSQDTVTSPQPRTTLVFRVQPGDFAEAMRRLEGVGRVIAQDISADDVTDRVVDLQSRISTAEVSVERLRSLLQGANTVEAIAALEGQLLERETNLELLRGQLRTIESAASLATITVTLSKEGAQAAVDLAVTAYEGDDDGTRCPGERRLTVDEGDAMVLCVSITNAGNVGVLDIEVRDHGLDLNRDDFTLVDFGADDVLAPGEEVLAWARVEADRNRHPYPSVSVVAVDEDGGPLRQATEITEEPVSLMVVEDDSLPGFGDSLARGWSALQFVFGVVIVALGVLVPLAVLILPVAAGVVWWRRRRQAPTLATPDGATIDDVG